MIFSRSAEYAIRALVCLAGSEPGSYMMAKDIAEKAELPTHFLAKILQQLARMHHLRSNKGPSGGFALVQPADKVRLFDIVTAIDGTLELDRYPFANNGKRNGNGHHDGWQTLRSTIVKYLEHTSIADLAGNTAARKAKKK